MPLQLSDIKSMLENINANKDGHFSKDPEPIAILNERISLLIRDTVIHLSEFVIAKVKGKIPALNYHPEITDDIFISLPSIIQYPQQVLKDTRASGKYLFIIESPFIEVVIEVRRIDSGKTEINTLHKITIEELKRLERKFPVVL